MPKQFDIASPTHAEKKSTHRNFSASTTGEKNRSIFSFFTQKKKTFTAPHQDSCPTQKSRYFSTVRCQIWSWLGVFVNLTLFTHPLRTSLLKDITAQRRHTTLRLGLLPAPPRRHATFELTVLPPPHGTSLSKNRGAGSCPVSRYCSTARSTVWFNSTLSWREVLGKSITSLRSYIRVFSVCGRKQHFLMLHAGCFRSSSAQTNLKVAQVEHLSMRSTLPVLPRRDKFDNCTRTPSLIARIALLHHPSPTHPHAVSTSRCAPTSTRGARSWRPRNYPRPAPTASACREASSRLIPTSLSAFVSGVVQHEWSKRTGMNH